MFVPPVLKNGNEFESWSREVKIWQCVTDLEVKKHGPAIYLSLEGRARQCCNTISIDNLISESGVQAITDKLQAMYKKDEHQVAFRRYKEFESFSRPEDMSMVDYINEFDRLYSRIKEKSMELPDDVLAYRLLKSANICEEKQALWKTIMPEMTFNNMKKQIEGIFTECNQVNSPSITVEPTFHSYADEKVVNGKSRNTAQKHRKKHRKSDESKKVNLSRCFICESTMHQARTCPHQHKKHQGDKQLSAFTKNIGENYMSQFLSETFNTAVLDSGCSKTVCGKIWLDCYLNSIPKEELLKIVDKDSDTRFKFGDGKTIESLKKVIIPARIGNVDIKIETDVISTDIPLLLSKDSMKAANTTIDFSNDKVIMLDQTLDLKFTSSGHYCVPITTIDETEVKVLLNICSKSVADKNKVSSKLHLQFGHAPSNKIIQLVKDVGIEDTELFQCITEAEKICSSCKSYKKRKLRPVVRFALAKEFNEVVSIDIKPYENIFLLHVIDHSTRFSAATVIQSKHNEVIIDNFCKHWVTLFDCPNRIQSDDKGDLDIELYMEMAELFNIEVLMTPSEYNGIKDKNTALIQSILEKIREETSCSIEVAVAWAVSAKNSLTNVYGFSPNQLVFGKNPNFSRLINNELPVLEGISSCDLITDHLNILHSARELFIQTETSENIKHSPPKKEESESTPEFSTGDDVFYKGLNSKVWNGPGTVIGKDEKHIFVKHQGTYYRVHHSHIRALIENEGLNNDIYDSLDESKEEEIYAYKNISSNIMDLSRHGNNENEVENYLSHNYRKDDC